MQRTSLKLFLIFFFFFLGEVGPESFSADQTYNSKSLTWIQQFLSTTLYFGSHY